MNNKIANCLVVILIIFTTYAVQIIESQEDYSFILGIWETYGEKRKGELTIKEISEAENKAVVSIKYEAAPSLNIPAGGYEVNNALFKPGPEPVIEFKSPTTGALNTFKFKRDGTAICTTSGVPRVPGSLFSDWKKKQIFTGKELNSAAEYL